MSLAPARAGASVLLEPFALGDLVLPNRVVMSPLTRNRVVPGADCPTEHVATYYAQRASAGLLIAEGAVVSRTARGYVWTPGIYSDAQVAAWSQVTDAVHQRGGRIFLQLWHAGRMSHPVFQPGHARPPAPSAVRARAKVYLAHGSADPATPRALTTAETRQAVDEFADAAGNASRAGFDGVELHGANGYLIDQFLRDGTNHRADAYGGDVDDRVRFVLEVVEAVTSVYPPSRVGIRLAPVSRHNDMRDSDPQRLFTHLAGRLGAAGLGFLDIVEGQLGGPREDPPFDYGALRRSFPGAYVANNGYTRELALKALASRDADLVAFGRSYIANPDLVERLARDAPLTEPDRFTYYFGGPRGYTDYPALAHDRPAARSST